MPTTEDDLQAATANRLLDESTGRIELKREIGPSGRKTNAELARDLASLAVEGGLYLVGIDEPQGAGPAQLRPVPLEGLPERVEQVALTRCDPPLSVRAVSVSSAADPSKGYLVVRVPASADAPHMVDDRYWGRGVTTKRVLLDREVAHLHERRRQLATTAETELDVFVSRDPVKASGLAHDGHLFVVVTPLGSRRDLMVDVLGHRDWQRTLVSFVRNRGWDPPFHGTFAPDLNNASIPGTTIDGWVLASYPTGQPIEYPEGAIALELGESGTVRLFCGRAVDDRNNDGTRLLFEELVTVLTLRTVTMAAAVADETGFGGRWACGLALTGLAGTRSWIASQHLLSQGRSYPGEEYRRFTTADAVEISEAPHEIADRLIGSLLRTMDVRHATKITAVLDR